MEQTIERLLEQAYLFDDPQAYRAGVEDAVAALEDLLEVSGEATGVALIRAEEQRERMPA